MGNAGFLSSGDVRNEKGWSGAIATPQQLHPRGIPNIPGTYGIKHGHPVLGGTRTDINVAEDVHGSHQAIEQPPAAGLGHDIRLLGHQPEGHEQPVDTCKEKGPRGQSHRWGRLQSAPGLGASLRVTAGWDTAKMIAGPTCHSKNPEGIQPGKEHQGQDPGPQHPRPPEQQAEDGRGRRVEVTRFQQAGEAAVGDQSPGEGEQGQPSADTCMGTGAVRSSEGHPTAL